MLAEPWDWSSVRFWKEGADRPSFLVPGPVKRPRDWFRWVNQAVTPGEGEAIGRSVNPGSPYGGTIWTARTASALGLESTIRLAELKPDHAKLIQLRYFTGLTGDEAAAVLSLSPATADRMARYAKAWLKLEMQK